MKKELERLENKWGKFVEDKYYYRLHCTNEKKQTYFHIVFKPNENFDKVFYNTEKLLESEILPELKELWKHYNGFKLFNQSINIYGMDDNYSSDYKPTLIFNNNMIYKIRFLSIKSKDIIIFGNYSQWLFCYNKYNFKEVFVIDKYNEEVVHRFESIEKLIHYYFDYLIEEYDCNAKKIHINENDKGTIFENRSFEMI